jgi:large subunit ribosomal protein LX
LSEVKTFKATGEVRKPGGNIPFSIEIRATKEQDAIERLYTDLGSRHKARRLEIRFDKVEELKPSHSEKEKRGK